MGTRVDFFLPGGFGPALGSLGLEGLLQCVSGGVVASLGLGWVFGSAFWCLPGLGRFFVGEWFPQRWLGIFCVSLCCGELDSRLRIASSCVLCLVLKRACYVQEKSVLNNVLGCSLGSVIDDVLKGTS